MLLTNAPKGTSDLLPSESYKWQYLESKFKSVCDSFGYKEIRFPTFEHTELFERGVGGTTDVVEKQMYTFNDKGGRSVTLRPEGTASVCRSFVQNNIYAEPLPAKMFYNISCFRYENKQKGRLREFHQFGVETFGANGPKIDSEVLSLALTFLKSVGLNDLTVHINSIGCPTCRTKYNQVLKEYLKPKFDELCPTCQSRYDRNPIRILDCKSEICNELCKDAPLLIDYICDECRTHFEGFRSYLDTLGISYEVDPSIVRGLDYYTKTVFEVISGEFTVCGGGRYDGLIEEVGGDPTPGLGFGLGIERLLMRLEETGIEIPNPDALDLYVAPLGDTAQLQAAKIVYELRSKGYKVDTDNIGRSLKAQMKYANKLGVKYVAVMGENELLEGKVNLKNMSTGEQQEVLIANIGDLLK